MEGFVPGLRRCLLSGFRMGEEMLEDRQKLEEELSSEMCICNL